MNPTLIGMGLGLLWGIYLLLQCTPKGIHSLALPQYAVLALAFACVCVAVSAVVRWYRR